MLALAQGFFDESGMESERTLITVPANAHKVRTSWVCRNGSKTALTVQFPFCLFAVLNAIVLFEFGHVSRSSLSGRGVMPLCAYSHQATARKHNADADYP